VAHTTGTIAPIPGVPVVGVPGAPIVVLLPVVPTTPVTPPAAFVPAIGMLVANQDVAPAPTMLWIEEEEVVPYVAPIFKPKPYRN